MKTLFFGSLIVLGLTFQNCSQRGFEPMDAVNSPESANFSGILINSETGAPVQDPKVEPILIQAKELLPTEVDLTALGPGTWSLTSGPEGLFVENNHILWIPQKGQRGATEVKVASTEGTSRSLQLQIAEVPEDSLKWGGPPGVYKDGDVGYVFIHGKGDEDRCNSNQRLEEYWGGGNVVIAPNAANRIMTCYDGREDVVSESPKVAKQILARRCGRFNRCILVVHSMGGLMAEYMMLHSRESVATDLDKDLFKDRDLFSQVKKKTLFVVGLSSAAGGSKVASIIENPSVNGGQLVVGLLARVFGSKNDSTHNLEPLRASRLIAPIGEDPGIPFFYVAGFSSNLLDSSLDLGGGLLSYLGLNISNSENYFNGDEEIAILDLITNFQARSDGLVDFRSTCGVRSENQGDGPHHDAALTDQMNYCFRAPKKANHYVWFATNLNHLRIVTNTSECQGNGPDCVSYFPQVSGNTLVRFPRWDRQNVPSIVRQLLTKDLPK